MFMFTFDSWDVGFLPADIIAYFRIVWLVISMRNNPCAFRVALLGFIYTILENWYDMEAI